MCAYKGSIRVEDASGVHLDLHEFRCRRFLRNVSRFQLDTGELVTRIDRNRYIIAATGEALVRTLESGENIGANEAHETSDGFGLS